MADLTYTTQDVTLFDNESDNHADINIAHELQTRDDDANTQLEEISNNTKDIHHYQEAGEAFYITYGATLTSKDTEYKLILITNPNGSGKDVEFQEYEISAVSVISGSYVKLRQYANPTITTNGTTLAQVNARVGNTNTSGINTYYLPTTSANGTLITYQVSTLPSPFRSEQWLGTGLMPNNSMLFTAEATTNGTSIQITIKYASYTD